MKNTTRSILGALLFLFATAAPSLASAKTITYAGSYKGQLCTVTLNWHDWTGLGTVDGHIELPDDTTIPFSGANPRNGVLQVEAGGEDFIMQKKKDGKITSWIGKNLTLTDGPPASLLPKKSTPTPTKRPGLLGGGATPKGTAKSLSTSHQGAGKTSYVGAWRGKRCTATIEWTLDPEADTIRRGTGMLIVEGDMAYSIEGWQPRSGYIEFGIAPDPTGENYKSTREVKDGVTSWTGSFLTLVEK